MPVPFFDAQLRMFDPGADAGPGAATLFVPNQGRNVPSPGPESAPAPIVSTLVERRRALVEEMLDAAGFVLCGGALLVPGVVGPGGVGPGVVGVEEVGPGGASAIDALLRPLGAGFVGVCRVPAQATDREILRLHGAGVRALSADLVRVTDPEAVEDVVDLALRARVLVGWHLEVHVDPDDLPDLLDLLPDPDGLVIDPSGPLGAPVLTHLVEEGARVKTRGVPPGDPEARSALEALFKANPQSLMAATGIDSGVGNSGVGNSGAGNSGAGDSTAAGALPGAGSVAALRGLRELFDDPDDLAAVTHRNAMSLYLRGGR